MKLVVTTIGSTGDLYPLFPVAAGLVSQGHRVHFAANESFRADVEREGFPFAPIGVPLGPAEYARHPEIFDPRMGGVLGLRALMRRFIVPHLPKVIADLDAACADAGALLAHPAQLAAPIVAASRGLRWATLSMFPGNVPSRHTVPQGMVQPIRGGRVGTALNAAAWATARFNLRLLFDRSLNAVRAANGLPPARDLFLLGGLSPQLTLILCSEAYCGRPDDWPASIHVTGYTPFDTPRGWSPPPGLDEFLAAGDPPVLVSLGTSVAVDPQAFYRDAETALERLGRRGLFLGAAIPSPRDPARCASHAYVPLSKVLSRCVLAVHPGGFGTTSAVVQAGLPAVIVPRAFDQAYHAERVADLGLGRVLAWSRLTARRLEHEIRTILCDPAYAARAAALRRRLVTEDGPGRATRVLAEWLARPPDASRTGLGPGSAV